MWISVELKYSIQIKHDGSAFWEKVFFSRIFWQDLLLSYLNSDSFIFLKIEKLPGLGEVFFGIDLMFSVCRANLNLAEY